MLNKLVRGVWVGVCFGAMLVLVSCGGTGAAPLDNTDPLGAVSISVAPQSMTLHTGDIQTFTATVSNTTKTSVTWLVNGIAGGSGEFGTIDKTGNYTAPPYTPIPPQVTVTAVSSADSTKSASAAVTIKGPLAPGSVTVSPATPSAYLGDLILFTATVNDKNPAVSWLVNNVPGGNAVVGTVAQVPDSEDQAIYVAPLTIPDSGQVTVTAISVANPAEAASAVVTLSQAPANGALVTISPLNATVPAGTEQKFQASVSKVDDKSVSWEVDGIPGGNAHVGTIVGGANQTAIYTAPGNVPVPPQLYVTAISQAQPNAMASAVVTVAPAQKVDVVVSVANDPVTPPCPVNWQLQFVATVTGTSDQSVTWEVNGITGGNGTYGTISASGLYTAPASVPSNSIVTVSAVSVANPSVVGKDPVTIVPAGVYVTLYPAQATVDVDGSQPFTAIVTGTDDSSIIWEVNGELGGDSTIGTVAPTYGEPEYDATYLAPSTVPNPNQVTVNAVSAVDQSAVGNSTVTIKGGTQIEVTVSPSGPTPVVVTQSLQFSATVTGTSNTAVTWSVSGQGCSGSACGTVDATGLYTAPANVPSNPDVDVTATSVADPQASGFGVVDITPSNQVSIAIYPSSVTLPAGSNPYSFSAIITNAPPNTNVSWQLGCISLYDGDAGEDCNDNDFDGDGPGCMELNGLKVCGNRSIGGPGNDPLSYIAPKNLFTNAFAPNACELTNNGSGDGMVPLSATINVQGCDQGTCTATACITITPP